MRVHTWRDCNAHSMFLVFITTCCLFPHLGDAFCGSNVHIPRVALMFLARGGMPLENIWEPWFQSIAGLIPASHAKDQLCASGDAIAVHGFDCQPPIPGVRISTNSADPVLSQQLLFSVYTHSSRLNFSDFEPSSVFRGTLLPDQGKAEWGDTTRAVKVLLTAALRDSMNSIFVLLSDSDVPLYPARLTYMQLIQEKVSRVDGCHAWNFVNLHRYTCAMAEDGIDIHHWRKSNLFMLLIRKHAQLFRDDTKVYESFQKKCSGVRFDEELNTFRGCLTDEHYYASYLASEGMAHETDCIGAITLANFTESVAGHPKLYNSSDVTPDLMARLRRTISWLPKGKCANETTYKASREAFLEPPLRSEELDCEDILKIPDMNPMDSVCHMFFRKFDASAVPGLLELMTKGPGDVAILSQ